MLNINTDTVCRLIQLAREFHAQEQVVIPETRGNPSGDWAAQTLASHIDDMSFQEFRSIVNDMEPEQQVQIVALMWIGRGDFETDEWDEVIEQAKDDWTPETAEYLIVHPMICEHLEDGLDMFGYGCD